MRPRKQENEKEEQSIKRGLWGRDSCPANTCVSILVIGGGDGYPMVAASV